jgi:hypothetical protein
MRPTRRSDPGATGTRNDAMSELDYDRKLTELDRLLNDPDSPMDPSKVWSLLAEVSNHERLAPDKCHDRT